MFDKATLLRHGATRSDLRHLEHRRLGGETGGAGYRYQGHFAAVAMLRAAAEYTDSGQDAEITQEVLCWVDDVLVRTGVAKFYQLKISPLESWGRARRKLAKEFERQHRLCRSANVTHSLHLVTPHKNRVAHFNAKAPASFRTVFSAEHFPLQRLRPQYWAAGGAANTAVRRLCAVDADSAAERDEVAARLISIWEDCGTPSDPQLVSAVLTKAWADPEVPIRRPNAPTPPRWSAVTAAASRVPGLALLLRDGFVCWEFRRPGGAKESGRIGASDSDAVARVIARVLARPPSDFDDFWREL